MDFSITYKDRAQHSCLQIYDLDTKSTKLIDTFDHVIEAPMWSKDGKSIFYNSEGRIYRYDLTLGKTEQVNTGACIYCNNDHVLSPDGNAVAVSGNVENTIESKIYIVPFATGKEEEIVSTPWSYLHGWSPDGASLAYCAGRPFGEAMEWDIYICPSEGGPETRLTDAPGLNDGCEFSSDGRSIWFNSNRTGRMQVYRMNTDGTNQQQMTFDEDMNSWFPHISPDLEKVVYLAYRAEDLEPGEHLPDKNVEIRMIPADGGAPVTLLRIFGGQGSINVNSWNSDSTKFAFVSYSG